MTKQSPPPAEPDVAASPPRAQSDANGPADRAEAVVAPRAPTGPNFGRRLGWLIARLGRRLAGEAEISPGEFERLKADSERHRIEAQAMLASSAEKSRFVALASHELRTPLNGILGLADLLGRTPLDPEQANYVNAIRSSGAALAMLVDDILDVGRVEAGKLEPRPAPVELESLIEEVVELLAPRAQAKGLELAAHVGAQVPRVILADARLLARILLNLAGNAIKFTETGGVAVEVAAQAAGEGAVAITLRVRDTGIGIAAADLARIFGEYEQIEGAAQTAAGTGLGLAISRAIARAIGGEIAVDSQRGVGSVFRFKAIFPLAGADAARSESRLPLACRRVLILSGGQVEPPLLMRRLYDLGATVDLAPDAEAAAAALGSGQHFDVVMVDHHRDRPASLTALRGPARGAAELPPAVVMIAPGDRDELPGLRKAGFAAHLVKPIRTASLTKIVRALAATGALPEPTTDTAVAGASAPFAAAASPERSPEQAGTPQSLLPLDVLLADDHEINALLGRSLLASLGHKVTRAANGLEAVQLAAGRIRAGQPFDVVMMDLHMPLVDGFAAIAAIREREEGGGKSLIIALSADTTEAAERLALARGADIVLTKPIDSPRLARILTERQLGAASGSTSRREIRRTAD
ncbi:MAG: ATP-binding protein [Ancalomicrobiaceae bacterium]|nr:ATP-binding protein [Ancalomicrobiaceae bacterium]